MSILAADWVARAGAVNLISLEPIKERLAERWPRKREQVWDHCQSFLKKQFRPEDMILPLDDLNVLIFQPGMASLTAQTKCVRACSELMKFFLGEVTPTTVQVKIVESIEADQVVCSAIDPDRLETMMLAGAPDIGKVERRSCTPLLTRVGRNLTLNLSLEPLWSLQPKPRVIGHYARVGLNDEATGRRIGSDRSLLQTGDLADIDVAVLKDALALRAASPKLMGGLILPISYVTLANTSTRFHLLQEVQRLDLANRKSFGWEVVDLEPGVPAGRLSELIGIARSHCRGVICRMEPTLPNAEKARAAGATLSLGPPESPHTEHSLFRLEGSMTAAVKAARAVLLHGVPQQLLPIASFVGATHCTLAQEAPA